jgi:hypothetical protein
MAHLDPAPDGGEECRRIDDSDGVESLGVVRGCQFGSLLEMTTEGPHHAKGDTAEVDNGHRSCDRRWWRWWR